MIDLSGPSIAYKLVSHRSEGWSGMSGNDAKRSERPWLQLVTNGAVAFCVGFLVLVVVFAMIGLRNYSPNESTSLIAVSGVANAGCRITLQPKTRYTVQYHRGAYSPEPLDLADRGQWLTAVFVYDRVYTDIWESSGPPTKGTRLDDPHLKVADAGYWSSRRLAEWAAQRTAPGLIEYVDVTEPITLILMPVDEYGSYDGNRGEVVLRIDPEVELAPPQPYEETNSSSSACASAE